MKKYSVWKDNEVVELFRIVEDYKQKNQSMLVAFDSYAKEYNRKRNSVRNYYYAELKELKNNEKRRQQLGIDITKHEVICPKNFSEKQTDDFVYQILKLTSKGHSIRKACLILSNNDITEMVRLQNKYRNILKSNKDIIERNIKKIESEGIKVKSPLRENQSFVSTKNNIISMPKSRNTLLSDSEISSLFLGLVKLVKKCAKEEAEQNYSKTSSSVNLSLRKSIVKISMLEVENKKLIKKLEDKASENKKLEERIKILKSEVASLSSPVKKEKISSKKYSKLEEFLKQLSNNNSKTSET